MVYTYQKFCLGLYLAIAKRPQRYFTHLKLNVIFIFLRKVYVLTNYHLGCKCWIAKVRHNMAILRKFARRKGKFHCIIYGAHEHFTVLCMVHMNIALYYVWCTWTFHCIVYGAHENFTVLCMVHMYILLYFVWRTWKFHCIVYSVHIRI